MEEAEPDATPKSRWQPSPVETWSKNLRLEIPIDQFRRLPHNVDYRFEYFDGAAQIRPRSHVSDAYLTIPDPSARPAGFDEEKTTIRPLTDGDWDALPPLFAAAFHRIAPFALLDDASLLQAARDCLKYTRDGGDGPLVASSCRVAVDRRDGEIVGGALITLPFSHQMLDFDERRKQVGPPPPPSTKATGWPHLTWIFVAPLLAGEGLGTALLDDLCRALWDLGYRELASSFQHGNSSSMRWHWRNGFQLIPYFGSKRWMMSRRRDRGPGA
jgi:GNAT superfamily N-acetyltransferase